MLKNIQILEGNKKEHYIVHFLQKYFFGCFSSICSILREKNEHVKYKFEHLSLCCKYVVDL